MELLLVLAVVLLVLGVAGSVVPLLPGPLLSLAGVLVYWWSTGYVEPSLPWLVALVALGLFAVVADYLGGAAAARAGGASTATSAAAAVVGVVLLFVAGPLGLLAGLAGTVFLLELRRHGDARAGGRSALYAVVGTLASAAVQLLFTGTMLVAVLAFALT